MSILAHEEKSQENLRILNGLIYAAGLRFDVITGRCWLVYSEETREGIKNLNPTISTLSSY